MLELFLESSAIMVIGLGTVITFLCLLIVAMRVMSSAIAKLNKIFPEAVVQNVSAKKSVSSNDEEIAVAIAVAKLRA